MGPIETQIYEKLKAALAPSEFSLENQSYKHNGHAGVQEFQAAMGKDYIGPIESHFDLYIKSAKFDGLNRVARQRLVFDILSTEMKMIHALALMTKGEND